MTEELQSTDISQRIVNALMEVLSKIPPSQERPSSDPAETARRITTTAAGKAAVVSAGLSLPPGPAGIATILPDLMLVWNIQSQMVADIAAVYGKTATLNQQQMIYCLFRHAAAQAVRDIVVRVGGRMIVKRAPLRVIQKSLQKIGVRITQRVAGRTISRWLPVVGALGVGGYSFWDTAQVGRTAQRLFSMPIEIEGESVEAQPAATTNAASPESDSGSGANPSDS